VNWLSRMTCDQCQTLQQNLTHLAFPACFSDGDRIVRLGGINPDETSWPFFMAFLHGSSPVR